jgi:diphthamide synthase (EF-2-diphthine--ammonia ligase)
MLQDCHTMSNQDYAPVYHNGLLCLPQQAVDTLVRAGLKAEVVQAAQRGLATDTYGDRLAEMSVSFQLLLEKLAQKFTPNN